MADKKPFGWSAHEVVELGPDPNASGCPKCGGLVEYGVHTCPPGHEKKLAMGYTVRACGACRHSDFRPRSWAWGHCALQASPENPAQNTVHHWGSCDAFVPDPDLTVAAGLKQHHRYLKETT